MAKIRGLKKCKLFGDMNYRELAILAPFVTEAEALPEVQVVAEGEPTQGLIIIKQGTLRLACKDVEGSYVDLGPGDFFGELSLLDGGNSRAVQAMATEPCSYLQMTPKAFSELRERHPEIAGKMAIQAAENTAENVKQAQEEIKRLLKTA